MLKKKSSRLPYSYFCYYHGPQLQAVRSGKWKLYLPLQIKLGSRPKQVGIPARLFDLAMDVQEKKNVAMQHPKVVRKLLSYAGIMRRDIGDWKVPGRNQRPAGEVRTAKPLVKKATSK